MKYIGSNIFFLFLLFVILKVVFDDKCFYCFKVWNKIGSMVSDNVYINVIGSMVYFYFKLKIYFL